MWTKQIRKATSSSLWVKTAELDCWKFLPLPYNMIVKTSFVNYVLFLLVFDEII